MKKAMILLNIIFLIIILNSCDNINNNTKNLDTTGYYTGTNYILNCDTIDFQEYHSIFTDTVTINIHTQIVEILVEVISPNDVTPAINSIKSIENQIGGLNITYNEKQALYGASSVAKFSLKYWNDEF